MATQTKSALQKLSSLSQSLNQVSDELSEQLAEVEKAINRFNLGVTASATLSTIERPDGVEIEELRYGKGNGKWGFSWVRYGDTDPEGTWDEKPLREAPRDVRLSAVRMLPHLLDELAKNAEGVAVKAAERVQQAREIAAALNHK